MIYGTKYWNSSSTYYTQDNNSIEALLKMSGVKGWLESCGPTSAANILDSMGKDVTISLPGGNNLVQIEDVISLFFDDPHNASQFSIIDPSFTFGTYPANESSKFYPYVIKTLFNVDVHRFEGIDYDFIISQIKQGNGVQISLKNPVHFNGVVAYDDVTDELIVRDPWAGRFQSGSGYNIRYTRAYFNQNINTTVLVYLN